MKSLISHYTDVAIKCDAVFSAALAAHGFDRWETDESAWPSDVRKAYAAKVIADEHMHQAWEMSRAKGGV